MSEREQKKPPERPVRLRIRRQDAADRPDTRRWEEHTVEGSPELTIAGALRQLELVTPIAFEYGCLEGECGACAISVDGHVRQACTTRVEAALGKRRSLVLEPLSKFPVVRDLIVDRAAERALRQRVSAWLDVDSEPDPSAAQRFEPGEQQRMLALSRCSECGACLEACPQFGEQTDFVGAATIANVHRLELHPIGKLGRRERLETLMAPGGVADCGKAENCVEVCPMDIPLVDSIQTLSRETSKHLLWDWLLG
jgi:succinate dehydrogenase / fumarate reductase iron-sulfur subunit